ncbi:MAG TPA: hypothetical protein VN253_05715 [Kofleriaceae bacterium]|nr:hypothetical protein [Kofleriaceae bacterium]
MSEIVFYGVPAFVGRVETLQVVYIWCDDPSRAPYSAPDPSRLIRIDFAKSLTPDNWTAELDAHRIDGGLTNIGPDIPFGSLQGAIYCVKSKWDECMDKGGWKPSVGEMECQYQCLARLADGPSIERFHGFRAKVVRAASSRVVLLDIYKAGDPETPQRQMWVDLYDDASCLSPEGGYTTIDPATPNSRAIFFSSKFIKSVGLTIPKLPPGYGSGTWPKARAQLNTNARDSNDDRKVRLVEVV